MSEECLFRGKWGKEFNKQLYGCSYYNEPNSLVFRNQCGYKTSEVRKCDLFEEREDGKE